MAGLLAGGRALVTGAGRGIGVEIARVLAAEGAAVAIAYRRSREGAEAVAEEIRAHGGTALTLQADLTDPDEAEILAREAHAALGGLNILVNNASGFGPLGTIAESSWERFDDEWNAVVRPVVLTTRAALPLLAENAETGGAWIVNLAATLALRRPQPRYGAHAMAKAAVLAFTRTLAREVGPQGIRVNAVSPGMTLTDFSESLPDEQKETVRGRTPLRRLATPEDVARVVLFFCSPMADFVTGADLAADGGLAAG